MERIKKTQGRKKIEIKMIADENARRVTFSKRRNGLFKKATELSTLCGVEIAVIVFSIGGKAFTFGHPSVDSVLNRYLNEGEQIDNDEHVEEDKEACYNKLHQLKKKLNEMKKELQDERKVKEKQFEMSSYKSFKECIEGLDLQQLQHLKGKMEDLKLKVARHVECLQSDKGKKHVVEGNLENIGKHTLEGLPIPRDWLRL